MEVDIRASVDLVGSTLRYAEVEHYGSRRRLLRLGNCDFDYDADGHLFGSATPTELGPVKEALQDVFQRLSSDIIHVVLNPGNVLFFNSVAPNDISDQELSKQLSTEAQYVSDVSPDDLRVFKQPLAYAGASESDSWNAIVAVRADLSERLDHVFSQLNSVDWSLRSNPFCATHVATLLSGSDSAGNEEEAISDSFELLLGWYADFVSFSVVRDEQLVFTQHMKSADPADCSFFGLQLLEQLGLSPENCTQVSLYGQLPEVDNFEMMAVLSGSRPRVMNPIRLVDIEEKTLVGDFDASAYVPVMGAIL